MVRQSMVKKRPISGGGEEARRGDQLLEADQPAAESPTGGDYITKEIDQNATKEAAMRSKYKRTNTSSKRN